MLSGNQLVGLSTCAVAIDRLFAVLLPVKHYVLGPLYAVYLLSSEHFKTSIRAIVRASREVFAREYVEYLQ